MTANKKFTIFVEDYNVPLSPWYILNDKNLTEDIPKLSNGKLLMDSLLVYEKNFVAWGPIEEQWTEAGDYFNNKIITDKSFLEKIYKGHYDSFEKIENICELLLSDSLKNKTNKQLFKIYDNAYNAFAECWTWALVIQFLDMGKIKFSEQFKSELNDKLNKFGNSEIVFSKLFAPVKETKVGKESATVLKLTRSIQNNKKILQEFRKSKNLAGLPEKLQISFRKIAKEFGWLQYYYVGPAANPEYYYDLVKRKITVNADKEIRNKKKEIQDLKKFHKKCELVFTKKELYKIRALREFGYLKEIRKEIQVYYLNYAMRKWYAEVARKFYWSPMQAMYVFRKEYEDILVKNKITIDANELNKRYDCCAYILNNGRTKFCTGKKAKEYKKMFIQSKQIKVKNIKELSGSVAYHGKVSGTVKIVNSVNDLGKFNDGDVLVSFSTNPSLVPAMNKASAIITNTGGIICHAAIVSRELKTPCIIGTKIATKVLKDGDLVEVDADNGVVKILKKAKNI